MAVAEVERTDVIRIAVNVRVRAVVIFVKGTIRIVTNVRRTGVKVVTSVLLDTAFVNVAFHRGAGVSVVITFDILVDTTVDINVAFFGRACVSIVTIDSWVLASGLLVAEV